MSGHVRRRSPSSWEIKFESGVDPATGRRATKYVSIKGTKKQAEARLIELLNDAARGALVDHSKETLAAFLARWRRDWATPAMHRQKPEKDGGS
jgi:integrase